LRISNGHAGHERAGGSQRAGDVRTFHDVLLKSLTLRNACSETLSCILVGAWSILRAQSRHAQVH
jgi:hypothetical protein